jgi:hypothetical protein
MKQRQQRLLDQDARMQERKHLIKEASTGYFEGYNEIRHRGGKQWQAPKALIQEKVHESACTLHRYRVLMKPASILLLICTCSGRSVLPRDRGDKLGQGSQGRDRPHERAPERQD